MKFYLLMQWSPEQIASHVLISLHSIYRFIRQDKNNGGTLFHHLRFRNLRKRKYGSSETCGQLSNRKSIHDRPAEIEQRTRFGDLEIDTIVGKNHQQSLVSIVDRKTGYIWLKKCHSRKAEEICQATMALLKPIKDQLKTITADTGKEFSMREREYVAQITHRLNHRSRKRLGFESPSQVLSQQHGVALYMLIFTLNESPSSAIKDWMVST